MIPSDKSPEMTDTLERLFGRSTAIKSNKCTNCWHDVDPTEFRDRLSEKEYTISGLCQNCQDEIFTVDGVTED